MPETAITSILRGPWDVVIVGHGFSGLTAGLAHVEAAIEAGRTPRVAVLERASYEDRGGSTRWTTAWLSLTRDRKLRPFLGERIRQNAGHLANTSYIDAFYELVPETLEWLEQHGVTLTHFEVGTEDGAWRIDGGGATIVNSFPQKIVDHGGAVFYNTSARRLIRSESGRVAGLEVQAEDGTIVTMETSAVILASGGFEGNPEWLTRYIPDAYKLKTVSPGTRGNRGDGIRMATEVGADTAGQFDGAHIEPCDSRSDGVEPLVTTYRYGILVNQAGKRFIDEAGDIVEIDFDTVANAIFREQNNIAYGINDAAQRRTIAGFDYMNLTEQEPISADTIEELAEKLGIDPHRLRATVEEYNGAIDDEGDYQPNGPLDGKHTTGITPSRSNYASPIAEAPFIAWPISGQICFTYGGLRVDGETHVLDAEGRPIEGLHAAGEIAGVFYNQYPAGTSGLRSMTFGRKAGLVSAAELAAAAVTS
ncbi:FAD-binding protein [Arthrobacter sp. W4I7]|uniref:FAD-binding protein n=1 Tax=Arthrobacter sp. W4I7 TaxID=3042296 RepID=UPI002789CC1D|nr:FAD-binding protein [Arthrobacter sp. W4I7]MDQ0691321.1 tricarballylate dehydrogenase [Arthrobacter sp. W4I7]